MLAVVVLLFDFAGDTRLTFSLTLVFQSTVTTQPPTPQYRHHQPPTPQYRYVTTDWIYEVQTGQADSRALMFGVPPPESQGSRPPATDECSQFPFIHLPGNGSPGSVRLIFIVLTSSL
ncbi:hypothetical protein SKAU_G00018430 [Synaphobranchus kaupii]|uniref:Uncharacterized protein n=1 Tax=Synaphobranchus kaupii TaxID=118154 RepID=A0A9Q1GBE2_SYNKA|nr:hypothetical protein SKAU_G00018430 [Synaphobranchus kaupii]